MSLPVYPKYGKQIMLENIRSSEKIRRYVRVAVPSFFGEFFLTP
jgi:hypothetical protein